MFVTGEQKRDENKNHKVFRRSLKHTRLKNEIFIVLPHHVPHISAHDSSCRVRRWCGAGSARRVPTAAPSTRRSGGCCRFASLPEGGRVLRHLRLLRSLAGDVRCSLEVNEVFSRNVSTVKKGYSKPVCG